MRRRGGWTLGDVSVLGNRFPSSRLPPYNEE
jgi:hypothetical protein